MRTAALSLLACGLAGCAPADRAEGAPPPALVGRFIAASDSARTVTGEMIIARAGLSFQSGQNLYTRVLNPRRGIDLIAFEGDSYAAAALAPSDATVELRRVTDAYAPDGVAPVCSQGSSQYVALVIDDGAASVTLLAFSGEEPPGPQATLSRLCGAYRYSAPDGARTRQGVLLQ